MYRCGVGIKSYRRIPRNIRRFFAFWTWHHEKVKRQDAGSSHGAVSAQGPTRHIWMGSGWVLFWQTTVFLWAVVPPYVTVYVFLEIPSRELNIIIPKKLHFEDDFRFPQVGYVNSLEGIYMSYLILISIQGHKCFSFQIVLHPWEFPWRATWCCFRVVACCFHHCGICKSWATILNHIHIICMCTHFFSFFLHLLNSINMANKFASSNFSQGCFWKGGTWEAVPSTIPGWGNQEYILGCPSFSTVCL